MSLGLSLIFQLALLGTLQLWTPIARADLLSLESGAKVTSTDLLKQGYLLIYIEKDCSACLSYVGRLDTCPGAVKEKIALVSVSSAANSQALQKQLPKNYPFFVSRQKPKFLRATPTTVSIEKTQVGILNCEQLGAFARL
jgi:hypothetical protein